MNISRDFLMIKKLCFEKSMIFSIILEMSIDIKDIINSRNFLVSYTEIFNEKFIIKDIRLKCLNIFIILN